MTVSVSSSPSSSDEAAPDARGAACVMIDAVHHYDGYIVQSTGDGIFALFGSGIDGLEHEFNSL